MTTKQGAGLRALADLLDTVPAEAVEAVRWSFEPINAPLIAAADPDVVLQEFIAGAADCGARVEIARRGRYVGALLLWPGVSLYVYGTPDQLSMKGHA